MTNKEKFEEVFGIKLKEHPLSICHSTSLTMCNSECDKCPSHGFWEREYVKNPGLTKKLSKRNMDEVRCINCKFLGDWDGNKYCKIDHHEMEDPRFTGCIAFENK